MCVECRAASSAWAGGDATVQDELRFTALSDELKGVVRRVVRQEIETNHDRQMAKLRADRDLVEGKADALRDVLTEIIATCEEAIPRHPDAKSLLMGIMGRARHGWREGR